MAQEFILREFADDVIQLEEPTGIENPKGELQELLQSHSPVAPEYRLISATGADHDRNFECAVFHNDVELGRGRGKSKKSAESEAAMTVLKILREQTGS
ncbi:MAG: putative dsRNA-binding protein [Limisphaerales bacterium]